MKILLPVDGSEYALAAVRHAIRLVGEGLDASFILANVQAPAYLIEVLLANPDAIGRATGATAADAIEGGRALLQQTNIPYQVEPATGDAVPVLLGLIERLGCDAVIMGTHGLAWARCLARHATRIGVTGAGSSGKRAGEIGQAGCLASHLKASRKSGAASSSANCAGSMRQRLMTNSLAGATSAHPHWNPP